MNIQNFQQYRTDLGNGKNYENVEPKSFERTHVMRSDGTWVPHELAASDNKRLPGDVRQPELKPQVKQMDDVNKRAKNGYNCRQGAVHVQTRGAASANGQRIEEQRVHSQRHATCEEERAVESLHALAAWIEHMSESGGGRTAVLGA